MIGVVYFLTNRAMPGVTKIGYTCGDVHERVSRLNTTGVPFPFDLEAMFRVEDPEVCERLIHAELTAHRLNKGREFFEIGLQVGLARAMPIILKHIVNGAPANDSETSPPAHILDDEQIFALQMLVHDARQSGMPAYLMSDMGHWADSLTLEYKLASLKEKGLVEEIKQRVGKANCWRATSKGVKFLFENGLILEDLLKERT